jgi:pimeloyl-ACP methyl ester carboxylesterase
MHVTEEELSIIIEGRHLHARKWTPADPRVSAPTILLFHDSIGSVELWRDFPRKLAAATGMTVVAYDRLGFGRSDAFPGKLPFSFIHDEGHKVAPLLCDALGLGAIIALGHSVGGGMAIATAAALGERCLGVIAMSAQSYVEVLTLDGVREARENFSRPGQLERLARYHGNKAAWALSAWIDTWLDPAYGDWTLDAELARVQCPALIIHGDTDEYGTTEHARRIHEKVGGPSRLVILEDCGHIPHREQAERVMAEIKAFLNTISPRPV